MCQAAEKIELADPGLALGVGFVAAQRDDVGAPVVVGSVQTLARERRLARLPRHFDTVIVDECIAGDSLVETDHGSVAIREVLQRDCRRVLSFDGSAPAWRDITAFLPRGERPVMQITLSSGRTVRCTSNHPVLTANGWMTAAQVSVGTTILCLANAAAEHYSGRNQWGRQQRFVAGHQVPKRSLVEWQRLYAELVASALLCQCGCGQQVRLRCGATLEQFIRSKGARTYARYLDQHDKRPANWMLELSDLERQAILGTLLGDSSILLPNRRSKNPRLVANHGLPQRDWVAHKARVLARLNVRVSERPNGGYGETAVRMHTSCLPCLEPIRRLVAPRAKGDQLGLAQRHRRNRARVVDRR